MKFSLVITAFIAIACAQITSACKNKKCGENDPQCISACISNINSCMDQCGGGQSCYDKCVSEWTPTITASDGSTVSTSDPLGTATADISGASTLVTASVPTGSINTAAGTSVIPTSSDSFLSASASLATAFSSATSSLSSQFSASIQSAASSVSASASSATASTTTSSDTVRSAIFSAKVIFSVIAVAIFAVAL
ncbi:hypothetical protein BGW37DRAFT_522067 [Umbelopsis sp. PMI_123]|nr:hypothetical protein BGW37DRAFT_522067 [Umbelopsis sp. PMI_123]